MPNQYSVKQSIFKELHNNPYPRHPWYQKFITTLRKYFYWPNMKREAIEYVARCFTCQQVKVIHQHLVGLLQHIPIPEWKWKTITMDFIMVIVDKLSKAVNFIPVKSTYNMLI